MTLAMLKKGERARITFIGTTGPIKRRLMDMGVIAGEEVRMDKVAPLGDPLAFTVKGYRLSLRKKEAQEIQVEAL
jgi:ferrous iron transport protein A